MFDFLEKIYHFFNKKEYLSTDPVYFPHNLSGNTEFIAFVSSLFAYGRVLSIQRFLKSFFDEYGVDPTKRKNKKNIYYRFQSSEDIYLFYLFLHEIYSEYGSILNFFITVSDSIEISYKIFRKSFLEGFLKNGTQGLKFLLPDIEKSSAKRLWMFFRWMVRYDNIDFGLWTRNYNKNMLKIPLDTHILTFGCNQGIINSKSSSRKNQHLITDFFSSINKNDPVKYDFALTRLGMVFGCKYSRSGSCASCVFKNGCFLIDN